MSESIRFQCRHCGEWHEGLPDMAFDAPTQYDQLVPAERQLAKKSDDICVIGEDFFIRATLPIRIIDSDEEFNFGCWVSLSKANFARYLDLFDATGGAWESPYFGWLCNRFPWYPDTLHLKTNVHLQPYPRRPWIELEPTDHPLAIHQRDGITRETLAEILRRTNIHPEVGTAFTLTGSFR